MFQTFFEATFKVTSYKYLSKVDLTKHFDNLKIAFHLLERIHKKSLRAVTLKTVCYLFDLVLSFASFHINFFY